MNDETLAAIIVGMEEKKNSKIDEIQTTYQLCWDKAEAKIKKVEIEYVKQLKALFESLLK